MPDLPAIEANEAVTVAAVPEKTFPNWFNTLMVVRPVKDNARIEFRPYNFATKELYPKTDKDLSMTTSEFFEYVGARPTLAQAMGLLTIELGKVAKETELTNAIDALKAGAGDPIDPAVQTQIDALQAQLDAVTASYQV